MDEQLLVDDLWHQKHQQHRGREYRAALVQVAQHLAAQLLGAQLDARLVARAAGKGGMHEVFGARGGARQSTGSNPALQAGLEVQLATGGGERRRRGRHAPTDTQEKTIGKKKTTSEMGE